MKNLTSSYITGFCLCIGLTIGAFALVQGHKVTGGMPVGVVIALVVLLALIQLCVQLFCFLHLGHEDRPRLNLWALGFTGLVLSILVGGSLWIMTNLNYHMASPLKQRQFLEHNSGF